jgi:hypothetical protein
MTSNRLLTTTTIVPPTTLILAFPQVYQVIFALRPETKYRLLLLLAAGFLYGHMKNIIRELLVYHWILKDRKHFSIKCSLFPVGSAIRLVGNVFLEPATWALGHAVPCSSPRQRCLCDCSQGTQLGYKYQQQHTQQQQGTDQERLKRETIHPR